MRQLVLFGTGVPDGLAEPHQVLPYVEQLVFIKSDKYNRGTLNVLFGTERMKGLDVMLLCHTIVFVS